MTGIDPVFTVGGSRPTASGCCGRSRPRVSLEPNAGLELAPVPLRVGLITSQGAPPTTTSSTSWRRRRYAWRVTVVDVRCRARPRAQRIKWALGQLAQLDLDAVVLARGGGSRTDLAPFDTELVARAIAAHAGAGDHRRRARDRPQRRRRGRVPRVQDAHRVRAAARRAASPTSWPGSTTRRSGSRRVPVNAWRSPRASSTTPGAGRGGARRPRWRGARAPRAGARAARRARPSAHRRGGRAARRLRRAGSRELGRRATRERRACSSTRRRELVTHARHQLRARTLRLDSHEAVVRALDPRRVLERGYSITRDGDGRVVRQADRVARRRGPRHRARDRPDHQPGRDDHGGTRE